MCPNRSKINSITTKVAAPAAISPNGSSVFATVSDVVPLAAVLLDTGADTSVVNYALVRSLRNAGVFCSVTPAGNHTLEPFMGEPIFVRDRVVLDKVSLSTSAGPLLLRNIAAWVVDDALSDPRLILSRSVMESLGYSLDALHVRARDHSLEWNLGTSTPAIPIPAAQITGSVLSLSRDDTIAMLSDNPVRYSAGVVSAPLLPAPTFPEETSSEQWSCLKDADVDDVTSTPQIKSTADADVLTLLDKRVTEAVECGLTAAGADKLREMLSRHSNVFRLQFGCDPPVRVPALSVRVRPGVAPAKCSTRRYPPTHQQFLDEHMAELEQAGLVYLNTSSRWASPPRIVPKSDGSYRMTVDLRAVNARTEPLVWPMPQLEVALGFLASSNCYFTLDWFRGY